MAIYVDRMRQFVHNPNLPSSGDLRQMLLDRNFQRDFLLGVGIGVTFRVARVAFGVGLTPATAVALGAATGLAREYVREVGENYSQGVLRGHERWMHVSGGRLIMATASGAVGGLLGFELADLASGIGTIAHGGAELGGRVVSGLGGLVNGGAGLVHDVPLIPGVAGLGDNILHNVGQGLHDWAADKPFIDRFAAPATEVSQSIPRSENPETANRIMKTYTFDGPDQHNIEIGADKNVSSLRGKATWLSFEAQVKDYVQEKYNGVYTITLDNLTKDGINAVDAGDRVKTFDFSQPVNLDPTNAFDKTLYDELAADSKFGAKLVSGTEIVAQQIYDDTTNALKTTGQPNPFKIVTGDFSMDHYFNNNSESPVPYRILANSEEYRKLLIQKLASLSEFKWTNSLDRLNCGELERILRQCVPDYWYQTPEELRNGLLKHYSRA